MILIAEHFDGFTPNKYVAGVNARLVAIQATRASLAREMGVRREIVTRLFTNPHPNPTLKTLISLERSLHYLEMEYGRRDRLPEVAGEDLRDLEVIQDIQQPGTPAVHEAGMVGSPDEESVQGNEGVDD